MQDSDHCSHSFLKGLKMMSEYFCDTLSEGRIAMYWQLLGPQIALDEWEYACRQAMLRETFHKVPLVSVLLEYVQEYRTAQREARKQDQARGQARLALREDTYGQAQVQALIASVWPAYEQEPPCSDPEARKAHLRVQRQQRQDEDAWPIERKG